MNRSKSTLRWFLFLAIALSGAIYSLPAISAPPPPPACPEGKVNTGCYPPEVTCFVPWNLPEQCAVLARNVGNPELCQDSISGVPSGDYDRDSRDLCEACCSNGCPFLNRPSQEGLQPCLSDCYESCHANFE